MKVKVEIFWMYSDLYYAVKVLKDDKWLHVRNFNSKERKKAIQYAIDLSKLENFNESSLLLEIPFEGNCSHEKKRCTRIGRHELSDLYFVRDGHTITD